MANEIEFVTKNENGLYQYYSIPHDNYHREPNQGFKICSKEELNKILLRNNHES